MNRRLVDEMQPALRVVPRAQSSMVRDRLSLTPLFPVTVCLLSVCAPQVNAADKNKDAFFEARIRPLLTQRCVRCHGGQRPKGRLRLDSQAGLRQGGSRGAVVTPGAPRTSLLIRAVRHDDDGLRMPPTGRLSAEEIADLERWIRAGAVWPATRHRRDANSGDLWSLEPIRRVTPPSAPAGWNDNPIDAFVRTRMAEHGLQPVQASDARSLVRRVYFDLLGLPPSWADVEDFVANPSETSYRALIDRLLESPRYGERWGRHWLDLARFADTQGGSVDCPIPAAHLYRDYVIDAFQKDKPYDVFIREQIAGDLMTEGASPAQFAERVIATGFVGLSLRNGIFKHYHPELIIEDTIDTIGRSILGMTVRCARCHDHKDDPISTEDYYRLYGIFASSRYPFSGSELPTFSAGESVRLISPVQWQQLPEATRQSLDTLAAKIQKTRASHSAHKTLREKQERLKNDVSRYHEIRRLGQSDPALRTSIDDQDIRIREVVSQLDNSVRDLWNQLKAAERAAGIERAYAMRDATPQRTRVHIYGDPYDPGPTVERGVPEILSAGYKLDIPDGQSGRLQLADWLTSESNPLTPRVAVNYIWQFHFGKGLVTTPDNFGFGGASPTHPQLLDWLASEFLSNGWSVKHLHRLILTSQTYRLSSRTRRSASGSNSRQSDVDPSNRWYWRFDRRRLDAESIRDSVLATSGALKTDRPGPHPFPPESSWQFSQHGPFKAVYPSTARSVYLMTQRIQRHPYLALFDGPDTNRPTPHRKQTAVALQALYLRNSDFVHQQSHRFAQRLAKQTDDGRMRVVEAVRSAWSRSPTESEIDAALAYVDRFSQESRKRAELDVGVDRTTLVLEYTFDDTIDDSSGLARHGTAHGDPQFAPGKIGKCLEFDGDGDFVDTQTTMNDLGSSFTVECWVKPGPEQASYGDIFGNHLGGGRGFVVQQEGTTLNRFRGSFGAGNDVWILTPGAQLAMGQWQRIAYVKSPTTATFFVDGKALASVNSRLAVEPSPLSLRVGLGISDVARSFHGAIDEFRVYKGIPQTYRLVIDPREIELAGWASYCRVLLTSNEFLYID